MENDTNVLIAKIADELKKKGVRAPEWAQFVKTGVHKERPPSDKNWWHLRVAAILRSVAVLGPVGVSKLRTKYGGKQRRGHKPSRFMKGSGSIVRKSLQQLEDLNFIKQVSIGVHKGRIITKDGKEFLNSITGETQKVKPKKETKPKKEKTPKAEVKEEPKVEEETPKEEPKPEEKVEEVKEEVKEEKTPEKETPENTDGKKEE